MRLRPSALLICVACCARSATALAEPLDQSKAIEKIELLGGRIQRDESLPGRPVTEIGFRPSCHFSEKHLSLLHAFPELRSLDLAFVRTSDAGIKELARLGNLRQLHLDPAEITPMVLLDLEQSRPNLQIFAEDVETFALADLRQRFGPEQFSVRRGLGVAGAKLREKVVVAIEFQSDCGDDDLQLLARFWHLRILTIRGSQVTDAGVEFLKELESLTTLTLRGTRVTDSALGELKKRTPKLKVVRQE